ncbi:hypothetical protein PV939_10725, partial [Ligilactobacillus salivarius]|nr:hypothetical protein [Ligilactobacillus salivarius]
SVYCLFFFTDTGTPEIYPLSLPDALSISKGDLTSNLLVNPVFLAIDTIPVFPHMLWGFFLSSICLLLNALQMICFRYTSVS